MHLQPASSPARLRDFVEENQLLGRLLQSSQEERKALEARLAEREGQLEQALEKAKSHSAALEGQVAEAQQSLAQRDEQLAGALLTRKEMEDLIVSLSDELQQALRRGGKASLPEGGRDGGRSGSFSSPPSSPHRLRLVPCGSPTATTKSPPTSRPPSRGLALVDQAGRIEAMEREHREALAKVRQQTQELVLKVKRAAEMEVQRGLRALERQAQDQLRILEQMDKRVTLLDGQARQALRLAATNASSMSAAKGSQQAAVGVHPGVGHPSGGEEQGGDASSWQPVDQRWVDAIKEAEKEIVDLRAQVETLSSHKAELEGALSLSRLAEAAHRRQAHEAIGSSARTREELVKYVEEVHELLGVNAGLQREKLALVGQLSAAEEAVKVLRRDVLSLQGQVVEARAENLETTIRVQRKRTLSNGGGGDKAVSSLPSSSNPSAEEALEAALSGIEHLKAFIKEASLESGGLEQQTRGLLTSARAEQQATQRALLLQIRRMQALEAMRLADVQEMNRLERRQLNG